MGLYGFAHGFLTTCCMIMGPANAHEYSRDKAGNFMVTGVLFGIFCGQGFSFVFVSIGAEPS